MLARWYLALASLQLGLCLLVGAQSCSEDCDVDGEDLAALMQLTSRVRSASRGNSRIQLTGRTLFSTNPAKSASYVVANFKNASLAALPACDHVEQAAVSINMGEHTVSMVFLKDTSVPSGSLSLQDVIKNKTEQVDAVLQGSSPYTPWIDNHEGWGIEFLNVANLMEDGGNVAVYTELDDAGEIDKYIVRLDIPHTLWTLEFAGVVSDQTEKAFYEDRLIGDDPDVCRSLDETGTSDSLVQSGWWKSTYMSANLTAAAAWAISVLGAVQVDDPYPWPPEHGCLGAVWLTVPGFELDLHFVWSAPYARGMQPTIEALAADEDATFVRYAATSGRFEQYMYNSLVLTVDSLDPYLQRLQDNGFPFMFVQSGSKYIVFANIPGNGITVQLQSKHASVGQPTQSEMCEDVFIR